MFEVFIEPETLLSFSKWDDNGWKNNINEQRKGAVKGTDRMGSFGEELFWLVLNLTECKQGGGLRPKELGKGKPLQCCKFTA